MFDGGGHRLLHQEYRALSPCLIIQIRFYRNHTQDKRRYVALLTSHLEAAGCEVHHALADGGRLIVLATLGFVHADAIFSWASSSSISMHQLVVIFLAVPMWPYHRSRFCRRTGDIGSMLASLLLLLHSRRLPFPLYTGTNLLICQLLGSLSCMTAFMVSVK